MHALVAVEEHNTTLEISPKKGPVCQVTQPPRLISL